MTRKDYERAANMLQQRYELAGDNYELAGNIQAIEDAFIEFFSGDNVQFDSARFRIACLPGLRPPMHPKRKAKP